MPDYILKGIDKAKWREFKAICDLAGITVKDSFIAHIDSLVKAFRNDPRYPIYYNQDRDKKSK